DEGALPRLRRFPIVRAGGEDAHQERNTAVADRRAGRIDEVVHAAAGLETEGAPLLRLSGSHRDKEQRNAPAEESPGDGPANDAPAHLDADNEPREEGAEGEEDEEELRLGGDEKRHRRN